MFYSDLMLRIGSTKTIEQQYENCSLKFGCPANWINYADQHADGIADKFEAVFAHVRKDDPRLSMICDDGVPLNRYRSLWDDDGPNNTIYARYIYSCLVPAICFYSLKVKEVATQFGITRDNGLALEIPMDPYYKSLNVSPEECSILFIEYPHKLFEELRKEIPDVINRASNITKDDFDPENALAIRSVSYDLNTEEEFYDLHPYNEVFRKRPSYSNQHEARAIIPNVNFVRYPVDNRESYVDNELFVHLPKLHEYASVIPASKVRRIVAYDFNETLENFTLSFRAS